MFDYKLEHICSYAALLESPPEIIGPVPEGLRLNYYVTAGEVTGPRISGRLRPVGADWMTVRIDGVAMVDVRTTIETHDGALIYMTYQGVCEFGKGGYQQVLEGNPPATVPLRVAPRLQCAHPDYQWVNRLQYFCIGEADTEKSIVTYDMYAAR